MKKLFCLIILVFAYSFVFSQINSEKLKSDKIIFIPNIGQYKDTNLEKVLFKADYKGGYVYLKENGMSFVLLQNSKIQNSIDLPILSTKSNNIKSRLSHRIDITFDNCNSNVWIEKKEESYEYFNFYLNNQSLMSIKGNSKIVYHNIYEGIDFIAYTNNLGEFEYDFEIKAYANANQIKLIVSDSDSLKVNSKGELKLFSRIGEITKNSPKAYQEDNIINCSYLINNQNEITFNIADYDKSKKLVVDPVTKIWSTYYGGSDDEAIYSIKTNSNNDVVISGFSSSNADIASKGYQNTLGGYEDAFIAKFDSNGVRLWATYFGGSNFDDAYDMAIDKNNNIIIVGETASDSSISTLGSHQEKYGGGLIDGFVAKFDNDGKLVWSTYFGGKDEEKINGVAVDNFDNLYVCGYTKSTNGIYYQGLQNSKNGQIDGFVAKFNPLGELNWSTYYGGENDDYLNKIAVDNSNEVIALGTTQSQFALSYNGSQMVLGGGNDAFLVKFASGGARKWATYYGGTEFDSGNSIVCDESKNIYFTGSTKSTSNIAKDGYQNAKSDLYDIYISKLNSDGYCQWATYLGGTGNDFGNALAFSNNNLLFAGTSNSTSTITYQAFQDTKSGGTDGLFAKFNSNGNLSYCSFYGSLGNDDLRACSWSKDKYYLGGFTNSTSNMAINGHQNSLIGLDDGLLTKFNDTYFKLDSIKSNCAGESDSIKILTNLSFTNANLFSIQLSDSIGNFTNPTVIGKFPSTGSTKVKVIYPINLKSSVNYKLRAVSSDPISTSEESNKVILSGKFTINLTKDTMCFSDYSQTITANDLEIFKYKWFIKNGTINSSNEERSISATLGKPNSTTEITVVKTNGTCSQTFTKLIYIRDILSVQILGAKDVCLGNTYEYTILNPLAKKFEWFAFNGVIIGSSTNNTVKVNWNVDASLLDLSVYAYDTFGCSYLTSYKVKLIKQIPTPIIGANSSCNKCEELYFADIDTSKYVINWGVSNGFILADNKTNIKVLWDSTSPNGEIYLNTSDKNTKCDFSNVLKIKLSKNPNIDYSPKKDTVCEFNKELLVTSSGNRIKNKWIIFDGEKNITIDSNLASFTWRKAGIGKIKLIKYNDSTKYKDSIENNLFIVRTPKNEAVFENSSRTFCRNDSIKININYKNGLLYKFSLVSNSFENGFLISYDQSGINQFKIPLNGYLLKSENVSFITKISYGNMDCNVYYDTIPLYFVRNSVSINIKNDTLFAEKGFESYQWYFDNVKINSATNDYYKAIKSGEYSIEAKYLSCSANAKYNYTKLGLEDETSNSLFKIFPNPSDGLLNILSSNYINKYIIINSIGEEVLSSNNQIKSIDLSRFPNGFYNLIIFSDNKIFNEKFQLIK